MSHLVIENEADMEHGLKYTCKLAKSSPIPEKNLDITFPSEGLMAIFMMNLFKEFVIKKIPANCGINLTLHVPEKNE